MIEKSVEFHSLLFLFLHKEIKIFTCSLKNLTTSTVLEFVCTFPSAMLVTNSRQHSRQNSTKDIEALRENFLNPSGKTCMNLKKTVKRSKLTRCTVCSRSFIFVALKTPTRDLQWSVCTTS